MKAPILKGEKVILKPWALDQAENYVRWFKDPAVNKFLARDFRGLNLKKEKEIIKKSNKNKTNFRWAIYTKTGVHIGSTGLHEIDRKANLKATWGVAIGDKNYWGQGYGTDTLRTILKFGFNKLKLNCVGLAVFPFNKRGIRCYEKCGFKIEGRERQSIRKGGKFIDDIIMGITKSNYNKFPPKADRPRAENIKKYARKK